MFHMRPLHSMSMSELPMISASSSRAKLSSRAKRGTLVFACTIRVTDAGKHQDPSLRSG
jgi:hypothetical protein